MDHNFKAEEWSRLSWSERVRQCRSMAEAARRLAEHAPPDMQAHYKGLRKGWLDLAQEIEAMKGSLHKATGETRAGPSPVPD